MKNLIVFLLATAASAQIGTNNTGVSPVGTGGGGGGTYTAGNGVSIDGSNVVSTTLANQCVPSISSGNLLISTPCNVQSGNVTLAFGSNITFDASSGTGVVQCGVSNAGAFTCWHNVTLSSCTNCTAVGSTSVAPVDACVVATATVTSGTVSSPVNVLQGRNCFRATTSSTVSVSADPSTGVYTFDMVSPPSVYSCTDSVGTDSYACTAIPAPGALSTGAAVYCFIAGTANTGAATFNLNSIGAIAIKKMSGAITTDLADNDIRVGQHVCMKYDGTNFQMISQLGNAASGGGLTVVKTTTPSSAVTCSDSSTWVDVQSLTLTGATSGNVIELDLQLERVTSSSTFEARIILDGQDIMATGTFGACTYNDQYAGIKGSIGLGSTELFNNTGCLRPSAYNMRFWKVTHTIGTNPVLKAQVRNCTADTIAVNYMEATIR